MVIVRSLPHSAMPCYFESSPQAYSEAPRHNRGQAKNRDAGCPCPPTGLPAEIAGDKRPCGFQMQHGFGMNRPLPNRLCPRSLRLMPSATGNPWTQFGTPVRRNAHNTISLNIRRGTYRALRRNTAKASGHPPGHASLPTVDDSQAEGPTLPVPCTLHASGLNLLPDSRMRQHHLRNGEAYDGTILSIGARQL